MLIVAHRIVIFKILPANQLRDDMRGLLVALLNMQEKFQWCDTQTCTVQILQQWTVQLIIN